MDIHFCGTAGADSSSTTVVDQLPDVVPTTHVVNTTVAALPAEVGAALGQATAQALLSADDAYRVVEQALDEYLQAHAGLDHVEARGEGEEDNGGEIEERLRKLPALGITVTPGVGKTHAAGRVAMRAARAGVPVLIVVPTNALARAYVEQINQAGGGEVATEYVARQSPEQVAEDPTKTPWLCHKLEAVRQAGEANHRPGQSLCRECPHGRKSEYECGVPEREQRAMQWFKGHRIDPWDYARCHFLYEGLPSVKTAPILVAPAAAFSEALAFHRGEDDHGRFQRVQRLVIVDEAIAPGKLVRAGLANVEQWLTRLAAIQKRAHEEIARWHGPGGADEIAAWTEVDDVAALGEEVFRELAAALAQKQAPDLARLSALLRATRAAKLTRSGIAAWERIGYTAEKDVFSSPLRALHALVRSMQACVIKTLPTSIEFYEAAPIIEWAKKRGSTIFLDATLPIWLRRSIEHWGGNVVHATARQNITVERVIGCSYARGRPKVRGFRAYARAMMHDYRAAAEGHARTGGLWAALCHQAHIVYGQQDAYDPAADTRSKAAIAASAAEQFAADTGCALGWFGAHDRGQDDWKFRHMLIFGQTLLGLVAGGDDDDGAGGSMATEYRLARAAAVTAGDDAAAWPAEVGALDEPAPGQIPLPRDPRVRGWLIDRYASDLVQAIGRARGARSPRTLRIELWGGVVSAEIDAALAAHGIEIASCWPNEIHNSQRGRPQEAAGADMEAAAAAIEGTGRRVTRVALCAAVRAAGGGIDTGRAADFVRARKAATKLSENTKRMHEPASTCRMASACPSRSRISA